MFFVLVLVLVLGGAAHLCACRSEPAAGHPVGDSPAARRVMELIEQVAATDSTVLLLGETGTGKEVFASRIHAVC